MAVTVLAQKQPEGKQGKNKLLYDTKHNIVSLKKKKINFLFVFLNVPHFISLYEWLTLYTKKKKKAKRCDISVFPFWLIGENVYNYVFRCGALSVDWWVKISK